MVCRNILRPEDCIEEKDPKDFYKKFNPTISTDIKIFSITQILFTTTVFNLVFINASLLSTLRYVYLEYL
ncbi:MAG: hypothetical protein CM15mP126_7790 [Gammaproteobacteria bacterium]|nr:MAG: hypothetical protein CM15mP126_7790 [Gammaproteobacteria bacterium]